MCKIPSKISFLSIATIPQRKVKKDSHCGKLGDRINTEVPARQKRKWERLSRSEVEPERKEYTEGQTIMFRFTH